MSWVRYIQGKLVRGLITFINMVTLAHQDFPYHDYHTDTTTGTYQNYSVGENNKDGRGTQHKAFIGKSTLIMCTQPVYIKLNNADNVIITLQANVYFRFFSNIQRIMYTDVDVAGTIHIWVEGVLPQEARTPE